MYKTIDELRDAVLQAGDALTLRMGVIRDAHGAGRLGVHVRENISKRLRSLGLAHYPHELPGDQNDPVRIYRQGTPMADLIDAVLNPSKTHDEELRQTIGGSSEEILEQIRELVCN
jgi:hypothetical protein